MAGVLGLLTKPQKRLCITLIQSEGAGDGQGDPGGGLRIRITEVEEMIRNRFEEAISRKLMSWKLAMKKWAVAARVPAGFVRFYHPFFECVSTDLIPA